MDSEEELDRKYMPPGKRMPALAQIGPDEIRVRQANYVASRKAWRALNNFPDKFSRNV